MEQFALKTGNFTKSCPSHSLRENKGNFSTILHRSGNQQDNYRATCRGIRATTGQLKGNKKLPSPPQKLHMRATENCPQLQG